MNIKNYTKRTQNLDFTQTRVQKFSLIGLLSLILLGALSVQNLAQSQSNEPQTGVWKFDGFTSAEENEGAGETYSASVSLPHNGETLHLALSCYIKGKSINYSIGGREKFEKAAQVAVKASRGRFTKEDSHIDMVFDSQAYPVKVSVYDINGEMGFHDNHKPNGRIITGFLRAKTAWVNATDLQISIPLKNSTNSICQVLKKCGVPQSYCNSTGR